MNLFCSQTFIKFFTKFLFLGGVGLDVRGNNYLESTEKGNKNND